MRIAIVNVQAPFVRGGAEFLAESLAAKLTAEGHQTEILRLPFKWYPEASLLKNMLSCRLMHLEAGNPDLVIALKFPAYLAPFPKKKLWLVHQFRQVYDLWGTTYQSIPNTPEGHSVRQMVIDADNYYLREAQAIYTNSKIVANRLFTYNGIKADGILYPPLLHPEKFQPGEHGDYFFYPSRLNAMKRQHVAIEAMCHTKSPFKLVIAGKADDDAYFKHLQKLIQRHRLEQRVQLLGWITEEEKAKWTSGAYAVLYLPFEEDSYGYVTLEAFHAHKPIVTFSDAGGTNEVMLDETNGLVLAPSPEALAEGMERLWADRPGTIRMGHEGNETIHRHGIEWPNILERLVA